MNPSPEPTFPCGKAVLYDGDSGARMDEQLVFSAKKPAFVI